MELREVIRKRASVRKFTSEAVPAEDLRQMAELAGKAPSVNNSQPWRFLAVTDKQVLQCMSTSVREKLQAILPDTADEEAARAKQQVDFFSTFFADSPAVMIVLTKPYEAVVDRAIKDSSVDHDTINELRGHPDILSIGAAVQNLLLAATDMGYASCWLSGPLVARESLEECIKVEKPWKIAAMVAVGKSASQVFQRERKPIDEVFEII